MKILKTVELKAIFVETEDDTYYRYGPNSWMIQMGESQEPVYFCEELEAEYQGYINNNELNDHGLRVWKHRTNKRLFLQQSYEWEDRLILLNETDTEGRQVVDEFKASSFNYDYWIPMTQSEFDSIKSYYKEIYENEK
jgi:hypothetical protein